VALRYPVCSQNNGFDLRIVLEHRPRSRTSKIDDNVSIGMLAYGLLNARVHWGGQSPSYPRETFGSTKGINNRKVLNGHTSRVKPALDCTGLKIK